MSWTWTERARPWMKQPVHGRATITRTASTGPGTTTSTLTHRSILSPLSNRSTYITTTKDTSDFKYQSRVDSNEMDIREFFVPNLKSIPGYRMELGWLLLSFNTCAVHRIGTDNTYHGICEETNPEFFPTLSKTHKARIYKGPTSTPTSNLRG